MSDDITRTNYSANSVLTSTALNTDFNQIVARINDFPGDQITDDTITKDKLSAGANANLILNTETATYTVLSTDEVNLISAASGTVTATLPTAIGNDGLSLLFKRTDSTIANQVIIDGNGSETIDGNTTIELLYQYDFLEIASDGANWVITRKDFKPVYVEAKGNGSEGITANTENIPFTEVTDTHSAWSGTVFTAPRADEYIINGHTRATSDFGSIQLYIDTGSGFVDTKRMNTDFGSADYGPFTSIVKLDAGDAFSVRFSSTVTLSDSDTFHYLNIRSLK